MALDVNVTYRTLYNAVLSKINSMCYNVGTNRLPSEMQSGYTKSGTVPTGWGRWSYGNYTYTIQNPIATVSTATVQSNLQAFLTDRGIWEELDQKGTPRGILTFFNNIAVFCRARMKVASSSRVNGSYTVYIAGTSGYAEIKDSTEKYLIAANEVSTVLDVLNSIIGVNSGAYIVHYNLGMSCSSNFIAFLNI